jgi:hypothetical protein
VGEGEKLTPKLSESSPPPFFPGFERFVFKSNAGHASFSANIVVKNILSGNIKLKCKNVADISAMRRKYGLDGNFMFWLWYKRLFYILYVQSS